MNVISSLARERSRVDLFDGTRAQWLDDRFDRPGSIFAVNGRRPDFLLPLHASAHVLHTWKFREPNYNNRAVESRHSSMPIPRLLVVARCKPIPRKLPVNISRARGGKEGKRERVSRIFFHTSLTMPVICARGPSITRQPPPHQNIVDMFFACVRTVSVPTRGGRFSRVKHQFNINTLIDAPASPRSRLNFQSPRRAAAREE
ncbi:hypothetical protein PUN28_003372 [Cardiocondyla obscurior]|uniref:Uncharacterized protein n=1 Tax=Cardiocondyla obscurior TaxID=286306 RepID=A0AAW2GMW9_9HYME